MKPLGCIVLAAGEGKRMKSALPKPLHRLCGRPMIEHVLMALAPLQPYPIVIVVGVGREEIQAALSGRPLQFAVQDPPLGTGHAVMAAQESFADFAGDLLITCADIPLVQPETLQALWQQHCNSGAAATILTALAEDPRGYGRIVRNKDGSVQAIVEERDASAEIRAIKEINAGLYCFQTQKLFRALATIRPNNVQGEYYLTDVIAQLVQHGERVQAIIAPTPEEVLGINDRVQLAQAEAILRRRLCEQLMRAGVTMRDPQTTYVEVGVEIGPDTVLEPGVVLRGQTRIGSGCVIGPHVQIEDSEIGAGCVIRQGSVLSGAKIDERVTIGPFAYVRAGCQIAAEARLGAHTEAVRATIGRGVKISHFSYIGDAIIGAKSNIGAGVVTCNYDGQTKHRTEIGEGAFIGSDAILVAPITIGAGAYIGAGSVITRDVPPGALAIERAEQRLIAGWAQRRRERAAQERQHSIAESEDDAGKADNDINGNGE